ncbi:hypothetical protein AGMMS49992_33380 [Clostridia bacterium]|nr:hypothetical protein AGMMS49992_33380 [Clostridia bacterium]
MKYIYPATIQQELEGGFSIWFDDLPGCATQGETLAEALDYGRDALGGWLDTTISLGRDVPTPSKSQSITLTHNQQVTLVDVDLDAYRAENDMRSVNRMVTLPARLNMRVKKAGINVSQVLQEALCAKLNVAHP